MAFTLCATFKRAIDRIKIDHQFFFLSQIYSSVDKLLSFQWKKTTNLFSIVQGRTRGKTSKLLSIPGFTLLIRENNYDCCNIYESAVSITSPLRTITGPLKEKKWSKRTQKRFQAKKNVLLVYLGTIAQLYTKKFPTSQSL